MTRSSRISPILQSSVLVLIIAACSGPAASATAPPTGTIAAGTPSPTTLAATPSPTWPPLPSDGAAQPGTYATLLDGARWTLDVNGSGWGSGVDPERIIIGKGSETVPYFAGLYFYGHADDLVSDACHWQGADVFPTSVDAYASALAAIDGFETTGPLDIVASGYQGKLVQLTVPLDADFDACDNGEYRSFQGRSDYDPGQVEGVRVVDLDGAGYLFFTVVQLNTPADVLDELEHMVDSLEIEPVG